MTASKRRSLSLPFELVEEILYRIPVESLLRFKTISKQWYALFNDKRFIYKLLHLSQERFVRLDVENQSIQIFNPETNALLRLPFSDELHIQQFSKTIHCDGLLLSICTKRGLSKIKELAVWNPLLSRVTWIEPSNSYRSSDIYGFGFNNVSRDKYKILRINFGKLPSEVEIYEFKSNLWRSVDATTLECNALSDSMSMNGNMYWIAQKSMVNSETESFIQSFDFSTETFKPVCCVPKAIECSLPSDQTVLLSGFRGDGLSLLYHHENVNIEVWVTSKLADGVVSWTKYFDVTPGPSILHSNSLRSSCPIYFIHKTNKIMLFCEELDLKELKANNVYTNVYEMREDKIEKKVEMTVRYSLCNYRCSNAYVPSLVPVTYLGELGSRKPKRYV